MNGQGCRDWRLGLRLTQGQLASLLRVTKGTVVEWENNALKELPPYIDDQRRLIELASIYEMHLNAGLQPEPNDRAFPIIAETLERLIDVRKDVARPRGIDHAMFSYVYLDKARQPHPTLSGLIATMPNPDDAERKWYQATLMENGQVKRTHGPCGRPGLAEMWLYEQTPPGYSFHEAPRPLRDMLYDTKKKTAPAD